MLRSITIGDLLDETAGRFPQKDAVVYPEKGLRYSYAQFQEICNQAARGFLSLGINRGENIAIWATNVPEWVISQFATAKIGGVLVTVNTSYRVHELEYLLHQSEATTLLLIDSYRDASYLEMIKEICPELDHCKPGELRSERLPHLRNVIYLGEERQPGMFLWSDILSLGAEASDEERIARQQSLHPDDVINMQYTSGTTGFPKGVMLSHVNIVNNAIKVAECQRLDETDRICIPVPFFHCFGCVMGTLASVATGATMVPVIAFDPEIVLDVVEQERCTALYGVPTMFIAELNHPSFPGRDLSSLRTGIMAGSPCPIEVMKNVVEKMGIREITIAYGQTESSPVITQTRPDDSIERRVTTVGRAHDEVEVKIIDPVTGETVPPGVQGELCTRGYLVMKGYYNMPEHTAKAIDHEGWLHTGDLATVDEDGYYRITGRLKDMIIRGGENIYPREIEEFLYTHPKVLDVQVVGVPDAKYGEQVLACIKVKPGEELTEEELLAYCEGKIARFKVPRYIQFVSEYPMTASGKIQKYKLREQAISAFGLETEDGIETA
ncbi:MULTISPECIES: AMP-binding protein [Brevibacillus]|jgi:fatty-acyl-CoA synthase|uniref:Long-chain-fatty-acid--CoA ligase n=1 Tax=Brevibacillus borstelensis AK1 TaxID=1300222 RepID=M8DB52_9BACL|nr:AMP-binding protein [Brevibacillus borstelensis]EMT53529.1 long-chain-fatty-acid--CoA ligase [Brevibacillus borstelensis AK1]KKX53088.1 AMP-binding protein [Brevibacillus borstelensis cifa_chp40]MBE5397863.1 AMP-binding protein [Brevibacillus borstelensis]MCC0565979.1 AMP-binding protein [Brevibacillus borstelensis]MCM3469423.1 AMP-binding protein [Brevibacillus borstelensis]